jgi:hypothetical protein
MGTGSTALRERDGGTEMDKRRGGKMDWAGPYRYSTADSNVVRSSTG